MNDINLDMLSKGGSTLVWFGGRDDVAFGCGRRLNCDGGAERRRVEPLRAIQIECSWRFGWSWVSKSEHIYIELPFFRLAVSGKLVLD